MSSPEDLYAKIRKEKTEEALSTGKKWIPLANGVPIAQLTADEVKGLIDEIKPMLRKPSDIDMIQIFNVLDGRRLSVDDFLKIYPDESKYLIHKAGTIMEEAGIPEIPEEKFPEGVEHVKYTFMNDVDASTTETLLEAASVGKADLRSAVNIGNMVRTVMCSPPDERIGTPVRVALVDKDMAWHLQQLMDWIHRKQASIIALRREGLSIEVAFRMEGIQPAPKPMTMWFHGADNRNKGWRLVGEEK